jgi:hypothetical protein
MPLRQVPKFAEQRLQDQVEGGEADARLELDPGRAYHAVSLRSRVLRGCVEQHGLADTRVTRQQQRFALDAEPVDEIAQGPQFVVTSDDDRRLTGRRSAL